MKAAFIIILVFAILGFGGVGFLFVENRSLQNQLISRTEEKTKIEAEFTALKNTDLAKENIGLRLELETTKENLTSEKEKTKSLEKNLSVAESKVSAFEEKLSKIKLSVAVLDAFNDLHYITSGLPLVERDTAKVDMAINALNSNSISNLWRTIKTGSAQIKDVGYGEVIMRVTSLIQDLIP